MKNTARLILDDSSQADETISLKQTSNEIKTGGKNPLLHNKVKAGQMAIPAKTGRL